MKTKIAGMIGYIACFFAAGVTLWISSVNLIEIGNRASGHYTLFSQMAILTDGEAVIYFSFWTLLFIVICFLSVKSLVRKKYIVSIIYSVIGILTVLLSIYVDTLFYYKSV